MATLLQQIKGAKTEETEVVIPDVLTGKRVRLSRNMLISPRIKIEIGGQVVTTSPRALLHAVLMLSHKKEIEIG